MIFNFLQTSKFKNYYLRMVQISEKIGLRKEFFRPKLVNPKLTKLTYLLSFASLLKLETENPGTESKKIAFLWLPHFSCKVMSLTSKANIIFWNRLKLKPITIMYHVLYQFECATWCTVMYIA